MIEVKDKKIAVLGMGKDGLSIAKSLSAMGGQVTAFGSGPELQSKKTEKELASVPCQIFWGEVPEEGLDNYDLIIHSTGSGLFHTAMEQARKTGVSVLSDLDLATRFMQAPIIAVTGTNGKSTTVAILHEIFKKQRKRVAVLGGDFGTWGEFLSDPKKYDYYLLELSSQRLENSTGFHPHIAVLLNLFPSHEERHAGGLPAYLDAKAKVFLEQEEGDFLIHEASAGNVRELIRQKRAKAKKVMFSFENPIDPPGVHREKRQLIWQGPDGSTDSYNLATAKIRRPAFFLNFMAALSVAHLCGVKPEVIRRVLSEFRGLPCRMENIRTVSEVTFVDDSRATNLGATSWALSSYSRPILWIAGGSMHKDVQIEDLARFAKGKVKLIILVGREKERLLKAWGQVAPIFEAKDMEDAVNLANDRAEPKDVVLFSPACAPDAYTQDLGLARGMEFQDLVKKLPETPRLIRRPTGFTRI